MKAIVFGCGRMGARHVQALQGLGFEIGGLFDVKPEAAQAVALQSGLGEGLVFQTPEAMLAQPSIDLAVIASTAPSHYTFTVMAIEHGIKKILCEKPLATSIADCENLISLAQKNGADVAVNHQMRFMPQYTQPKSMMLSDEFGGLQSISVTTGNFGLAMNGTHYIEMMRFMFDEAPETVTAWFDDGDVPNPRGQEFKDKAGIVVLRTASGKTCILNSRETQGHGLWVTYAGRYGQIMVDELAGRLYAVSRVNPDDRSLPTTRYGQPAESRTLDIQPVDIIESTQSVVKALMSGENYPSAAEATLAIRALAAAYASHENGHVPQSIQANTDKGRVFPWA